MKKLLLLIFLSGSFTSFSQRVPHKEVFDKMMASIRGVKTCSFILDLHERIKGQLRLTEFIVKQQTNPFKVYAYSVTPNPGSEALLVNGENNNKVYINPNRFPFITISLSAYSSILRKNHQYTFWQIGYNFFYEALDSYYEKFGNSFYNYLYLEKDVVWKGKTFYQLVIDRNDFHFDDYTVQKGETMTTIADKLKVNDYMILEANPHYRHFDDIEVGDIIKVPNAFGKKVILYVDKTTFLPLVQIIYDHKGLYSRIEFTSFVLNPNFNTNDFSKNNKKYGF